MFKAGDRIVHKTCGRLYITIAGVSDGDGVYNVLIGEHGKEQVAALNSQSYINSHFVLLSRPRKSHPLTSIFKT